MTNQRIHTFQVVVTGVAMSEHADREKKRLLEHSILETEIREALHELVIVRSSV